MLIRCWPRRPSAPARPWPTEADHLPVERGLQVQDPGVLERRELITQVMCHVQVSLELERFACEWRDLQDLAADGLVPLEEHADVGGGAGDGPGPLVDPQHCRGVRPGAAPAAQRIAAGVTSTPLSVATVRR